MNGKGTNMLFHLTYWKIYPLRDAAFDADCFTLPRILKIVIVGLEIDSGTAVKNCYML